MNEETLIFQRIYYSNSWFFLALIRCCCHFSWPKMDGEIDVNKQMNRWIDGQTDE
jgi:hypothetical protein